METAAALSAHGISSVVYDTGEHGVGGRLGTRELGRDKALVFDHAAQYFTANDQRFSDRVSRWRAAGVVAPWTGAVGTLSVGGAFAPLPALPQRYFATEGMRSLAEYVLGNEAPLATVKRPCWVGEMRADTSAGVWRLRQNGRELDQHHFVVIAHNGKCANRLVRPSGAPLVDAQMARMKLSSIWCLMAAFTQPLGAPFEGAHVTGLPALSWAGNNSAKLGLAASPECWTLFSSAAYGRANKCPQEAVPADVAQRVTADMLDALSKALGKPLPPTSFTRTQLWGAALPTNTPRVAAIFDGAARVAMCGDWLTGASMQDAALSGQAAADAIAAAVADSHAGRDSLAHLSVGLNARFVPISASDIGTADVRQAPRQPAKAEQGGSGRSYVSRGERRNAKGALQAEVRSLNTR